MTLTKAAKLTLAIGLICFVLPNLIKPPKIRHIESLKTSEEILDFFWRNMNRGFFWDAPDAYTTAYSDKEYVIQIAYPTILGRYSYKMIYNPETKAVLKTSTWFIPGIWKTIWALIISFGLYRVLRVNGL